MEKLKKKILGRQTKIKQNWWKNQKKKYRTDKQKWNKNHIYIRKLKIYFISLNTKLMTTNQNNILKSYCITWLINPFLP